MMHTYTTQGFTISPFMFAAIKRYVEHGEIPGDFLQAVIRNDLNGACAHADSTNLENLPAFPKFFYNYCPSPCWGSKEKMNDWAARFQAPDGLYVKSPHLRPALE